jgi:NAD(P)-dependent dehydrogenase (short-subunit alcohol dehydrogenase family)
MGRATVFRLAAEGAQVIVADRDETGGRHVVTHVQQQGSTGWFELVELADAASIERLGAAIAQHVDAVHVLVNCAGIGYLGGPVETAGAEGWDPLMDVNLKAPALVAKAILPLMKAHGGAIVNVSSDGGLCGRKGSWIYDATKAGLISLSKSMAAELWPHGIRVNAIAPGWTVTEFHFARHSDPAARKREMEEMWTDYCVMGRLGRPEEIAAAIAFLASDDASFVTGTTLCVDGGRVGMDLRSVYRE